MSYGIGDLDYGINYEKESTNKVILTTTDSSSAGIDLSPNGSYNYVTTGNIGMGSISPGYSLSIGATQDTYSVVDLPRKRMPEKVFVQGRLITCGLLGTEVESAYTGDSQLIFSPGVLGSVIQYGASVLRTMSLEYHDAIYHYVIDHVPGKGQSTTKASVRLVSTVKKEAR